MKKLTKKILIMLVTLLVVFANSSTVFADEGKIVQAKDNAKLAINGLEGGETVKLYQVVSATFTKDTNTNNETISYTLNSNLTEGSEKIVLLAAKDAAEQADVDAGYAAALGDPIAEVAINVADLPVDADGKIAAAGKKHTVKINGADIEFDYPSTYDEKYPFTTSAPTEKQISNISAAVNSNKLSLPEKQVDGDVTVDTTNKKWEVTAYAAAKNNIDASVTKVTPAIYEATGIYLAQVTAGPDNPATTDVNEADIIYNPVIISVGYVGNNGVMEFQGKGINVDGAVYTAPTNAAPKKDRPGVEKTVTGGYDETFACPVVATDENGDPRYVEGHNGEPDYFLYVKAASGAAQTDVDDGMAKEVGGEVWTSNVEEALLNTATNNKTGALGTKFDYQVKPTLPTYPANSVNKTLWFSDKMSTGLDYVDGSLNVTLGKSNTVVTKVFTYGTAQEKGTYLFLVPVAEGLSGEGYYQLDNVWTKVDATNTGPATHYLLAKAKDNEDGFNINFDYDAIPAADRVKEGVVLSYQGVITNEAFKGIKGNPNVVTMIYANEPDKGSTYKELDKPTNTTGLREVHDEKVVYTYEIYYKKVDDKGNPLSGAVFGLYAAEEIKYTDLTVAYIADQLINTSETINGIGRFDEILPGNYYIQEISAPDGFERNTTKYPVVVNAANATKEIRTSGTTTYEYTTDITKAIDYSATATPKAKQEGWLVGVGTGDFYELADYPEGTEANQWTFALGENQTVMGTLTNNTTHQVIYDVARAYVAKETHVSSETVTEVDHSNDPAKNRGFVYVAQVPNTKKSELPSTGGIGTYLFTTAGVAILATAAFMLIFRKKEES